MEKQILGLDIGIASVGWAFVNLEEEVFDNEKTPFSENKLKITGGEIRGLGVRTFQPPIDRNKKSLAAIRGNARRRRATIERRAERMKYLIRISKKYGLIPSDFSYQDFQLPKNTIAAQTDVWMLRKKGLEAPLTDFELFRVLYHIAKHRGFYFPTKEERNQIDVKNNEKQENETEEDKKDKKIKGALKKNIQKLKKSQALTIGEYYADLCPFPSEIKDQNKIGRKHNKSGTYDFSIPRELLLEEVKILFEKQRTYGNQKATDDFEEEYIDSVLMYDFLSDKNNQEKYTKKLHKMMGKCEFFPEEECCPKESYSSELFSFYNRLNALKIGKTFLSRDQRQKVLDLVLSKNKVSFSELRETLNVENDTRFNLCSYREINPEYVNYLTFERTKDGLTVKPNKKEIADKIYDTYLTETGEIQDNFENVFFEKVEAIFQKYPAMKNKKYSFYDIRNMVKLPVEIRFSCLKKAYVKQPNELKNGMAEYLWQFEKDIFFEMKGYHKIKSKFKEEFNKINDPEKLDCIAEALVKYKTDDLRRDFLRNADFKEEQIEKILELNMKDLSGFSFKALRKLNPFMEEGKDFEEAKVKAGLIKPQSEKSSFVEPYDGYFKNNANVSRIISQVRKVVNAVIRKYGVPDEIHIELATDVANSKKKKEMIASGQARYKEARDRARERCLENGLDPDEGANLLRFRLAEEQDFRCPYTGKAIVLIPDEKNLYIQDCEIDHIIPFSRSFNDSLVNKVLCAPKANQEKKNMLPFEWLKGKENSEEWQKFKARIKIMPLPYTKKKNLLLEHFDEQDQEGFISRNLNDTRYACRHIAEYLRENFDFSKSPRADIKDVNRVRVFGGMITASLRHMWGLEKHRDENDRHHALDAAVVACTTFGHIYYICNIKKKCEENHFKCLKNDMRPWAGISDEIRDKVSKIFVSRPPRKNATGQVHKDTIFPRKGNKGSLPIRNGLAEKDNMFRYDVFQKEGRFYVVPLYLSDFLEKDRSDYFQPYEKEGNDYKKPDETYDFLFSVYKDDYLKIETEEGDVFEGYMNQYSAQSGQFYIGSQDSSAMYSLSTSSFEKDEIIVVPDNGKKVICKVSGFDADTQKLQAISMENGKIFEMDATAKVNKKGEIQKIYKTKMTYEKLDKEKKIKISVFKKIRKYQVDPLGNCIEVKSEKRLPLEKKTERQRKEDRYNRDFYKNHSE